MNSTTFLHRVHRGVIITRGVSRATVRPGTKQSDKIRHEVIASMMKDGWQRSPRARQDCLYIYGTFSATDAHIELAHG